MGGKLSTPNSPRGSRNGTITERPTAGPGGVPQSRAASLSVGAMGRSHPHPMLHFNPSLLADNPEAINVRLGRAHSTVEGSMHIPRTNFGWFYAGRRPDSDSSPDDEAGPSRVLPNLPGRSDVSRSLPHYLISSMRDAKCPLCSKMIPAEDVEVHFVMCLTKPRVTYNEDVLSASGGECAICLDELEEGNSIARLPCLCVYHKDCIDEWFKKSQTCPEHPPD